jgi:hypothetical protein
VAKVRERLAVNKQRSLRFHMERSSLKKLNEVKDKGQYRVEVPNRFATLQNSNAKVDINSVWETVERMSKFQPKRVYVIMN